MALTIIGLLGCRGDAQTVDECWAPSTQKAATDVTRSIVLERLWLSAKISKGEALTDQERKRLSDATTVVLSDFFVSDRKPDIGRSSCGANAKLSVTKTAGPAIAGESSIEFEIYRGEKGSMVTVPRAQISMFVDAALADQ
jgi:hypothetical protein